MTAPDPLREAVARRLFSWDTEEHPEPKPTWGNLAEHQREVWRSGADAVLALLDARPAPEGVTLTEAEWEELRSRCPACSGLGCVGCEDVASSVERIIAARQAPTALDREAVIGSIHRALAPRMMEVFEAVTGSQAKYDALLDLLADAVLAALPGVTQAPTVAFDVETVGGELDRHGYVRTTAGHECPCGHVYCEQPPGAYMEPDRGWLNEAIRDHKAAAVVAADPRRTEAEVKAEALREAAERFATGAAERIGGEARATHDGPNARDRD